MWGKSAGTWLWAAELMLREQAHTQMGCPKQTHTLKWDVPSTLKTHPGWQWYSSVISWLLLLQQWTWQIFWGFLQGRFHKTSFVRALGNASCALNCQENLWCANTIKLHRAGIASPSAGWGMRWGNSSLQNTDIGNGLEFWADCPEWSFPLPSTVSTMGHVLVESAATEPFLLRDSIPSGRWVYKLHYQQRRCSAMLCKLLEILVLPALFL